jgi:hypothetical protein
MLLDNVQKQRQGKERFARLYDAKRFSFEKPRDTRVHLIDMAAQKVLFN